MSSSIEFGKEQEMLQGIAQKFFHDKWTIDSVRDQLARDLSYDEGLWREMAELGWMGIAIPERYGGLDLELGAVTSVVEAMGRSLFASPFVTGQLVAQGLLAGGSEAQKSEWLPRLAEGAVATLAAVESGGDWNLAVCDCAATPVEGGFALTGAKTFVTDAQSADLFMTTVSVDGAPAIALLGSDRLSGDRLTREIVVDETRRSYRLDLDGVELDAESFITGSSAERSLAALEAAGLLLVSAEACGGLAAVLALIVEYLNQRRQFGKKIGSYQALKHPTVDILIGLERSRSHLYHAATVYGSDDARDALRMLKAEASDSFAFASDRAIQFHGGFGFTYECNAQLFLRRALWCQYQFGDGQYQRKKLADSLL